MPVSFDMLVPDSYAKKTELKAELENLQDLYPIRDEYSISDNRKNLFELAESIDVISKRFLCDELNEEAFNGIKGLYYTQYIKILSEMFENDIRIVKDAYPFSVELSVENNIANCESLIAIIENMSKIYSDLYCPDYFNKLINNVKIRTLKILCQKHGPIKQGIMFLKQRIIFLEIDSSRASQKITTTDKENVMPRTCKRKLSVQAGFIMYRLAREASLLRYKLIELEKANKKLEKAKNEFLRRHCIHSGQTS